MVTADSDKGNCTKFIHDKNGIMRQCKFKAKHKNLCGVHYKIQLREEKTVNQDSKNINKLENDQKFNSEYLDNNFRHNLMDLYNSWNEIDQKEYIELSNGIWPICIIIDIFTHQINNSNMENPYPIFPHNPFTRKLFTPVDLIHLKEKIIELKIPINVSLKLLLKQQESSIDYLYREADSYLDRHSILLLSLLQQHLRFMIINYKNSQNNYIGFWVKKFRELGEFEELYNDYKQVPYQIFDDGLIITNPYREYLKYVLKNYEIDESKPNNEQYCELIV